MNISSFPISNYCQLHTLLISHETVSQRYRRYTLFNNRKTTIALVVLHER